jgi:hypothetical protein
MVELYIPKTRFLFNNQYDLVDQEGNLLYRHSTNFLQTRRYIVNANNEVIMNSRSVFGFLEKHIISQNNMFVAEVSYKSIWSRTIVSKDGLTFKVKGFMRFTIFDNNEEVLSITRSKQKEYSYIVNVKEGQIDFLLMLMFTIIVMLNKPAYS